MAVIRKHQPNTSNMLRNNVEDAMSIVGEQVFILRMFSSVNKPDNDDRCSYCFDEVYTNSSTSEYDSHVCPRCFGTTYEHGINEIYYTKAIVGKALNSDNMEQNRGQSVFTSHRVKTTWPARLHKNDFIVRVFSYSFGKDAIGTKLVKPKDIRIYKVVSSSNHTVIKDGFYNTGLESDRVGSSFDIVEQNREHPLYEYNYPSISLQLIRERQPFVYFPDYILTQANKNDIVIS